MKMWCMSMDVHWGKRGKTGDQKLQVVLLADTDVAFCPYSTFFSYVFLLHILETHDKHCSITINCGGQ